MKAQRLNEAYARRRDAEYERIQKTLAVDRYFNHWGKVTSRFENWTTPEYYENVEESLRKDREKKLKYQQLEDRREKLRQLLEKEKCEQEVEMRALKRPKSMRISTNLLENIDKNQKQLAEERRKLELESKLYKQWRHGAKDDQTLFESNTDHLTLAKLNWLDKKIEDHMKKEQETKEAEERQLELEKEARQRAELLKEREKIRESEIKELRGIQENHLQELKSRDDESNKLHENEIILRNQIEQLDNEIESLLTRKTAPTVTIPHNLNRIKSFFRQRSDEVRNDMKNDIKLLQRIVNNCSGDYRQFLQKFEMLYDIELQKQTQIEAMYESEAKHNLMKWEEEWNQQAKSREIQIKNILTKQKSIIQDELEENLNQQRRLLNVRETLLASIENSNEKLKVIINDNEIGNQPIDEVPSACESGEINSQLSNISISDNSINKPRFGRKKVAWT